MNVNERTIGPEVGDNVIIDERPHVIYSISHKNDAIVFEARDPRPFAGAFASLAYFGPLQLLWDGKVDAWRLLPRADSIADLRDGLRRLSELCRLHSETREGGVSPLMALGNYEAREMASCCLHAATALEAVRRERFKPL